MNNRVIKFRAWDKGENKMYVGTTPFRGELETNIAIQLGGKIVIETHEQYYPNISSYDFGTQQPYQDIIELMQYTGLKDKNGKETFSGDIVSDRINQPFVVDLWNFPLMVRLSEIEFEIIGNVWEHPQLLTPSK